MEILQFIIFVILAVFLIYQQIRLTYNRYVRTYKNETRTYLSEKGINFVETNSPKGSDKNRNPFKEDLQISFGPYTRGITWTKYEYLIIVGEKDDKYQEFWLELKTTYFRKPKLTFKSGMKITYEKEIDISIENENCPECGFLLFNFEETICPNCGYNLKPKISNILL